jgi:hypothetical protein
MKTTVNEDEFLKFLHNEGLYENIFKYICYLTIDVIEFFQFGPTFLDDLFYSKIFKNLSVDKQLEILNLLNKYSARYSDSVYIEALWYPKEIQDFVKENLPREYSQRHIEDIEN